MRLGRGAQLTGRNMRAHFTICAKGPAGSGHVTDEGETRKPSATPAWPANALRLALREWSAGSDDMD